MASRDSGFTPITREQAEKVFRDAGKNELLWLDFIYAIYPKDDPAWDQPKGARHGEHYSPAQAAMMHACMYGPIKEWHKPGPGRGMLVRLR